MQKTLLTVLFLFFISSGCFGQFMSRTLPAKPGAAPGADKPATENKPPELVGLAGQKAPSFKALSMSGTEYNTDALRGKIIVLNLWGTFCEPCITEMPKLNALVEKYKGKDVVFLAAAPDEKTLLEGFLQKHTFKYEVLPGAFGIVKQYAPKKKTPLPTDKPGGFIMLLPTHLVIDREGNVTNHFWGYKQTVTDDLSQIIDKLLARKFVSPAASKAQ